MTGADHYTEDLLYKKVDGKQSTMQVLFHKCLTWSQSESLTHVGTPAHVRSVKHPHMWVV